VAHRPGAVEPVRAAADGAILPLIVFSVAFGLAASRIPAAGRETVVSFFRGLFDAMLTLVRWILEFAPIGVFALALPLATRLGLAAAGAVLYYIVVVAAICLLFIGCSIRWPPCSAASRRVASRGALRPAQSIAFSARSSLAALPAMIDGGAKHLGFGAADTGFFLPLSASMFRLGGAIGIPAGVLFVCQLYGIPLGPAELATIALTSVLLTFSIPGVPGGSILIMVPVLLAVGAPPEGYRHPAGRRHDSRHVPHHHQRDRHHDGRHGAVGRTGHASSARCSAATGATPSPTAWIRMATCSRSWMLLRGRGQVKVLVPAEIRAVMRARVCAECGCATKCAVLCVRAHAAGLER
jgi:hypothetical protein